MKYFRLLLQIFLPLLVIGGGGYLAYWIVTNKAVPVVKPVSKVGPLVRVQTAVLSNEQLHVTARGSVEALRTVDLAAEVGGRIIKTHPALRAGGKFTPNDVLVEIDATDYELLITQQTAAVARAELRLMQEEAEAAAAIRSWEQIEGSAPMDPLARREPQIRDAKLALDAAKAQKQRAVTDLLRTRMQLPFSGRVRSVHADIGQTVQRGQRLAIVLDTSELEVRLPVPLRETAFVDLPLGDRTDDGPKVELTADFAGAPCTWHGSIVRVEGEIDRQTRQLTAIARVTRKPDSKPLLVGMFVEARIFGREVRDVFRVPSSALHSGDHIWIVEAVADEAHGEAGEGQAGEVEKVKKTTYRLRDRVVTVVRTERNHAILKDGLKAGEQVCLSNLQAPIDGMKVRIRAPQGETAGKAGGK
ncbi:MAG: multidrug efflux system membrane fusion protein [Planctomycetota bacterium]|jgi:multidrug efflux system membrane fusion protein